MPTHVPHLLQHKTTFAGLNQGQLLYDRVFHYGNPGPGVLRNNYRGRSIQIAESVHAYSCSIFFQKIGRQLLQLSAKQQEAAHSCCKLTETHRQVLDHLSLPQLPSKGTLFGKCGFQPHEFYLFSPLTSSLHTGPHASDQAGHDQIQSTACLPDTLQYSDAFSILSLVSKTGKHT